MKNRLVISEKFYSIQGEGAQTGFPAIFLRLAGCNILCKGKGWVCDTIEVWRKGDQVSFENVFDNVEIERLRDGVHLVITGGEPLLHQESIVSFLRWFEEMFGFVPFIEIETNGTLMPDHYLFAVVKQWNVSPKLATSGVSFQDRHKYLVLHMFTGFENINFKFVVSSDDDLLEIQSIFSFVDRKKIILMPAGDTQELLNAVRERVIDLCKIHNYRYCDRLHIVAWNKKTGV